MMNTPIPIVFSLLFLWVNSCSSDQLQQVHLIVRHGDRTPIKVYPTDPNKSFWESWIPGQLTTIGMEQLFLQGSRLQERYISLLNFINSTYQSREISIESAHLDRCLQSCSSQMAAFYSKSKDTYPSTSSWPTNWTPIPVQTVSGIHRHTIDIHNCPRTEELMALRGTNEKFLEYQALHSPMIETISKNSGEPLKDFKSLMFFYDCVRIEKEIYHKPQPSWITDQLFQELQSYFFRSVGFLDGNADFGEGESTELIKLAGGPFLTKMLSDMAAVQNSTEPTQTKMFIYGGHDSTIDAVLRALGIVNKVVGTKNAEYAAMLSFELWKDSAGAYYVQIMFSADSKSRFIPVTSYITACSFTTQCPFPVFYNRNRPYFIRNMGEECAKLW